MITMFEGRIAIYIGMNESARRYFWDPATKKLSADETWVIFPMQKGQTTATAPTPIGDWIAFQLNGVGSKKVASSIVVANQKDPKQHEGHLPVRAIEEGRVELRAAQVRSRPREQHDLLGRHGRGQGGRHQARPATGELETKFVVDDMSTTFQPLIGPKDKRVLLLTNMKKNVAKEPINGLLITANYKEQVTWRDALTGRKLAESDFFEPLTINSLITPGFGGRCYFPTAQRFHHPAGHAGGGCREVMAKRTHK